MIHTGIVQYLSEIDTNIFLYFNGIHSLASKNDV